MTGTLLAPAERGTGSGAKSFHLPTYNTEELLLILWGEGIIPGQREAPVSSDK
jgi:hypothetical protein